MRIWYHLITEKLEEKNNSRETIKRMPGSLVRPPLRTQVHSIHKLILSYKKAGFLEIRLPVTFSLITHTQKHLSSGLWFQGKRMAGASKANVECVKRKISAPALCTSAMKTYSVSTSSSTLALRKSASAKGHNCLCSPTTHAGSFRCRYHRNSGLVHSGMTVGSKLLDLAGKSTAHRHSSSSPTYVPA